MFLSDFRNLNKQLNCKPYPMPHINVILLTLEGFQYAIPLDLNMRQFYIQVAEDVSNSCTIFLPWGNTIYKHLPIGVSNAPEHFENNMNDLFRVFEFFCAYIYDLLILTKGYWTYHVQ